MSDDPQYTDPKAEDGYERNQEPAAETEPNEVLRQQPAERAPAIGGDGADVESAAESDLWSGRTSWKHYAGRIGLWLAGNIVAGILIGWAVGQIESVTWKFGFWAITAVAVVSGLLVLGRVVAVILGNRYRLTSQRLFIERGILSQTVDQTELIRVDDVRIRKTLVDRLFGLGSVEVLSTDTSDREIVIEGIAGAEEVAESMRSRMRSMRKKSLFIENL